MPKTCANVQAWPFTPWPGVVDDELVAVPGKGDRVGLDRIVVVARRPIRQVDGVGGIDQCGLGIADQHLDGLSHEAVGRPRVCPRLLEGSRGDDSYATSIREAA